MFLGDLDPGQAAKNTPREKALMTTKLKWLEVLP